MGISGISDYSYMFQNYRVPSIPTVDVEQIRKQQEDALMSQDFANTTESNPVLTIETKANRTNTSLEDISLSFNASEDYGYIGMDSNIASLDMEKAISDMKKDQVLHQYQYFVGSPINLTSEENQVDGKVIIKE